MLSNLKPGPNEPLKITALSQALLLRELYEGPCSQRYLVETVGLGITTVRNYLLALRRVKLVYIAAWDKDSKGAAIIPCFQWGPEMKDVKKPVKSNAVRSREYKARLKLRMLQNGLTNSIEAG